MLIREKLPQGANYPQITQVPENYADFLDTFRGGHTLDNNVDAMSIASTIHAAMLKIGINSGHLKKTNNNLFPNGLMDVFLTKEGSELIQTAVDRKFCEMAVAEAKKSIAEDDGRPHPYVGVVIVEDGKILATGFRGESGKGDHGEYCALKKLSGTDVQGATVYTTLEPCSERNPPKKSCTERLIDTKVARVVSGSADKDESVYGHSTLVEAGIEIGFFPHDLMQELHALNKKWSDSRRAKQGFPPSNDTNAIANASYYKPGTSMMDNLRLVVRPPKDADGFFTVEDMAKNVLGYGRTLEEIAIEWHRIDTQQVIVEKRMRQSSSSTNRLLNLT